MAGAIPVIYYMKITYKNSENGLFIWYTIDVVRSKLTSISSGRMALVIVTCHIVLDIFNVINEQRHAHDAVSMQK